MKAIPLFIKVEDEHCHEGCPFLRGCVFDGEGYCNLFSEGLRHTKDYGGYPERARRCDQCRNIIENDS